MKDRLNEIIEKKGLTATKFAALIDANPSAISHLLKGRNKPGYDLLVNIARAFPDISMDWLLTGKGSMYGTTSATEKITEEKKLVEKKTPSVSDTPTSAPDIPIPPVNAGKTLKRIVLFFTDGSFEDYSKG